MHRTTLSLVSVLSVLFILSIYGCAQAPIEDMEQAEAALEQARTSEAQRYAPEAFGDAEEALAKAKTAVETEAEKFPLTRSYQEANQLLTETKIAAADAERAAMEGREKARVDATDALARVSELLAEAKTAVEEMPAKAKKAEGEEMKAVLQDAVAAIDSAKSDFERGDYLAALTKADGAQSRLTWVIDGTKGDQAT